MSTRKLPEREIDRLFAGHEPADADVARLTPFVRAARAEAAGLPSDESISAFAARLGAEATSDAALALRGKARKVGATARPVRRRAVLASVVATVGVVGLGGTAVAANSAVPGDALYGLDQALEVIGIGNGGTAERLDEASVLANEGKVDAALTHAARALQAEGEGDGAVALSETAAVIAEDPATQGDAREAVAAMISWMRSTDRHGAEFGQEVSQRAHEIRDARRENRGSADDNSSDDPNDNGSSDKPNDDNGRHAGQGSSSTRDASRPGDDS
jgi:hypothetical protein